MKQNEPVEGILKVNEFGDSVHYYVRCACGNDDCSHDIEIEADTSGVQVHIYVKTRTKWWEMNRWKQIWNILTRGETDYQTTIVLNERVAQNYLNALSSAIETISNMRNTNV